MSLSNRLHGPSLGVSLSLGQAAEVVICGVGAAGGVEGVVASPDLVGEPLQRLRPGQRQWTRP